MHPFERARTIAARLKAPPSRDWPEHWRGILQDPDASSAVRRIAHQALQNLGFQWREPGSDDE